MGKLTKTMLTILAVAYLCVGVHLGTVMWVAMPALNWKGGLYIALTWPLQLRASPIKLPIPSWVFTFPAGRSALGASPSGVGDERASLAESVSEGLRPFASESSCQSEGES